MSGAAHDTHFAGSIPEVYEQYLVPLIFAPYAGDLAERCAARTPARVLEIAAGTGVATRELAARLPASAAIVATDFNQPMLEVAARRGTARPVEWRAADAHRLPFPNASFAAVVCQFGVMFFADKQQAFREARRVLEPGGLLLFSVWDRIEENDFAAVVTAALAALFPDDPPRFLARTPHGYGDPALIVRDLEAGGFAAQPEFTTLAARSLAATAAIPAIAYCQGTPLRSEIEARGAERLVEATDIATAALARRFGAANLDGKIQAQIVAIKR